MYVESFACKKLINRAGSNGHRPLRSAFLIQASYRHSRCKSGRRKGFQQVGLPGLALVCGVPRNISIASSKYDEPSLLLNLFCHVRAHISAAGRRVSSYVIIENVPFG